MCNHKVSNDEKMEYIKILYDRKITLTDIVSLACKYVLYTASFTKGANADTSLLCDKIIKEEYQEFSRKFNIFRTLFAIDHAVFLKNGSKNSYAFSYEEALFVRDLFIRMKENRLWDQIIKINNRDLLGFVNFYNKTKDKEAFFKELTFVVDGLCSLFETDKELNNNQSFKHYIIGVTRYSYIEIIRLIDQIQLLSVDKLLNGGAKLYTSYAHYLARLYHEIGNELYKQNKLLIEDLVEVILTERISNDLEEQVRHNQAIKSLVKNMKSIDDSLYSGLSVDNTYNYFCDLEENADFYAEQGISFDNRKIAKLRWENSREYISRVIRCDIMDAFEKLSEDEQTILSENLLKAAFE